MRFEFFSVYEYLCIYAMFRDSLTSDHVHFLVYEVQEVYLPPDCVRRQQAARPRGGEPTGAA